MQLKAAIRRLLETKGVRARVLDKVNRYGEVVIGVILERPAPPVHVALPEAGAGARDARDARDAEAQDAEAIVQPRDRV